MNLRDRYRGALLGLALLTAESRVARGRFDPADVMGRCLRWLRTGYLSSTGRCFNVGATTLSTLNRYEATGRPWQGRPDGRSNGCLMRLAPVPLCFAADPRRAVRESVRSARVTHGAAEVADCCRVLAVVLVGCLRGLAKAALLRDAADLAGRLRPPVAAVAAGSCRRRRARRIHAGFDALSCLEAALWAFHGGRDFADVVLRAANLGDDADTAAAGAGAVAGAWYGVGAIPAGWRRRLVMRGRIVNLADRLFKLAGGGRRGSWRRARLLLPQPGGVL